MRPVGWSSCPKPTGWRRLTLSRAGVWSSGTERPLSRTNIPERPCKIVTPSPLPTVTARRGSLFMSLCLAGGLLLPVALSCIVAARVTSLVQTGLPHCFPLCNITCPNCNGRLCVFVDGCPLPPPPPEGKYHRRRDMGERGEVHSQYRAKISRYKALPPKNPRVKIAKSWRPRKSQKRLWL